MNSAQAKQIKITNYLNINHEKNEFFIKSPFNPSEKTPSFKINQKKNIWYDHSRGEGGNILDLIMKLYNCDLKKTLQILQTSDFSFSLAKNSQSFKEINTEKDESEQVKIKKIVELQNTSLIEYLQKRKIDISIAKKYLKEIYYTQKNKNYFALAFKNNEDGYETRNPYFKGCVGSKNITTIKGSDNRKLSIFEGFMDFLSALTHYKIDVFKSDVIILNSVSNKQKIEDLLYSDLYKNIYLFLDNDAAGEDVKKYFYGVNNNCVDCSKIYEDYKDFNEFLKS